MLGLFRNPEYQFSRIAAHLTCVLLFRAVTESINQLINICTVSAPGQKECDNALRQIEVYFHFYKRENKNKS